MRCLAFFGLLLTFAVSNSSFAQTSQLQLDAVLIESSDLMQVGDSEAALALLKRYEENFSSQPEFLNNLAIAYLGTSQPLEALTILRQIVDSDPVYSIVAHNLLELELQVSEGPPDTLNPVLFVQSTRSFFETELTELENSDASASIQVAEQVPEIVPEQISEIVPEQAPEIVAVVQSEPIPPSLDNVTQPSSEQTILQQLSEAWAESWSNADVGNYLNFYADDYQPDQNTPHIQWRGNRDAALTRSGNISVVLSEFEVQIDGERARVQFVQAYRSSNYSDRVLKTLVYSLADEGWRIISESSTTIE